MAEQRPNDSDAPATETANAETGQRIAKVMARAGLCSRREAERWIEEGRVTVNGNKITSPALAVTDADQIVVDGKPLPVKQPTRMWMYHKPAGLVTTARDEKGRPTVFDNLPKDMPRVISIGRLDLNSEGLLLLTNDGELARKLELPATGWRRIYRVRVRGRVDEAKLQSLANGVTVDGVRYGAIEAVLENQQGSNAWVKITLQEGKNREIRRVMEHLGYAVNRLIRVSYGKFDLGRLEKGDVEEIPPGAIRIAEGRQHKGAKAKPKKGLRKSGKKTYGKKPAVKRPDGRKAASKRPGAKRPDARKPDGRGRDGN
ncbi:pseudouridine synthase [Aestuariispira insulae]|uniref:Pseudouridine synthase n=1 Tax=Aestuariispira insulae TaxID=1461337 RepID=A0A3D9HHS0_9PROT|nr:pseudouridine synthase [Aestuariispira insulae]RED48516.1 pseudouridine synthase [Aestuariispira insulae]